jgi:hypothetical protein
MNERTSMSSNPITVITMTKHQSPFTQKKKKSNFAASHFFQGEEIT